MATEMPRGSGASSPRELEEDPSFSSAAVRLCARGLTPPQQSDVAGPRRVAVCFRSDGMEPVERLALDARFERDAVVDCPSRPGVATRMARLWCSEPDLAELAAEWSFARALLAAHRNVVTPPARARLMGVVNVTPDSFSDGGKYFDAARAVEHALALEAAGVEILDVGGESTRPGADPVPLEEELRRVLPVVAGIARRTRARISVDTTKAEVARRAIDEGATIINDVSAGRFDPAMLPVVAERRAHFIAMHMQGAPRDMQTAPHYDDPVADVLEFLRERAIACLRAGIPRERIVVDPGIGFGKRLAHNLELIARAHELRSLGLPLCIGVSRKSFIAAVCAKAASRDAACAAPRADDRVGGTAAALTVAILAGAEILRVHDAAVMQQASAVASALSAWNRASMHSRKPDEIDAPSSFSSEDRDLGNG